MGPDSTSSSPSPSSSANNNSNSSSTSSLSNSVTTSQLSSLSVLAGLSGSATLPRTVSSASNNSGSSVSLKLPLTDREINRSFREHTLHHHHHQLTQSFPGGTGTPVSPTTAAILNVSGAALGISCSGEPMSLPLTHRNPNHASNAFDALNKMRQTNQVSYKRRVPSSQ